MTDHSTSRTRARAGIRGALAPMILMAILAAMLVAAPAEARTPPRSAACRPLVAAKARVHAAAVRRAATLARLVAALQARRDPWSMNAGQISVLQDASSGVSALDAQVQSACYSTLAELRAEASPLISNFRVYWLRVPQTHGIEAADRLAEVRARLGTVAAKLAGHVGSNSRAQSDLAAMNQALAAADAKLGTAPTPAPNVGALAALAPAADMTADVAAMRAARADLEAARTALVDARGAGLRVLTDLGI